MESKNRLKQFEIQKKLGFGSYGVIFRVMKRSDKKIYVLKQIDLRNMKQKMRKNAVNQAHLLAKLKNPFIVEYFESFIEENKLNIIMQYCQGGDLSLYLKQQNGRPLKEDKIWQFMLQIILGLQHIHRKRILHRDIKTLNIFLTKQERVKIGDLGVAKLLNDSVDFAQTMVGTPFYLSPELCEQKPYNQKSDIWALGCLIYQMCTYRHPFEAANQGSLILKIVRGKYNPIATGYSKQLRDIVDNCLQRDYKRRPTAALLLSRVYCQQKIQNLGLKVVMDKYSLEQEKKKQQSKLNPVNVQPTPVKINESSPKTNFDQTKKKQDQQLKKKQQQQKRKKQAQLKRRQDQKRIRQQAQRKQQILKKAEQRRKQQLRKVQQKKKQQDQFKQYLKKQQMIRQQNRKQQLRRQEAQLRRQQFKKQLIKQEIRREQQKKEEQRKEQIKKQIAKKQQLRKEEKKTQQLRKQQKRKQELKKAELKRKQQENERQRLIKQQQQRIEKAKAYDKTPVKKVKNQKQIQSRVYQKRSVDLNKYHRPSQSKAQVKIVKPTGNQVPTNLINKLNNKSSSQKSVVNYYEQNKPTQKYPKKKQIMQPSNFPPRIRKGAPQGKARNALNPNKNNVSKQQQQMVLDLPDDPKQKFNTTQQQERPTTTQSNSVFKLKNIIDNQDILKKYQSLQYESNTNQQNKLEQSQQGGQREDKSDSVEHEKQQQDSQDQQKSTSQQKNKEQQQQQFDHEEQFQKQNIQQPKQEFEDSFQDFNFYNKQSSPNQQYSQPQQQLQDVNIWQYDEQPELPDFQQNDEALMQEQQSTEMALESTNSKINLQQKLESNIRRQDQLNKLMQLKIDQCKKAFKSNYEEVIEFFRKKINMDSEYNEDDEKEVDEFLRKKNLTNNNKFQNIYKIMHFQMELQNCRNIIQGLCRKLNQLPK